MCEASCPPAIIILILSLCHHHVTAKGTLGLLSIVPRYAEEWTTNTLNTRDPIGSKNQVSWGWGIPLRPSPYFLSVWTLRCCITAGHQTKGFLFMTPSSATQTTLAIFVHLSSYIIFAKSNVFYVSANWKRMKRLINGGVDQGGNSSRRQVRWWASICDN